MPGETNLSILLKNIQPILHEDEYGFCTFSKI
ncbi:MAG: transporter, partial [Calditrichia bacterium]|nr:transporter [Calditrichia bacterium]